MLHLIQIFNKRIKRQIHNRLQSSHGSWLASSGSVLRKEITIRSHPQPLIRNQLKLSKALLPPPNREGHNEGERKTWLRDGFYGSLTGLLIIHIGPRALMFHLQFPEVPGHDTSSWGVIWVLTRTQMLWGWHPPMHEISCSRMCSNLLILLWVAALLQEELGNRDILSAKPRNCIYKACWRIGWFWHHLSGCWSSNEKQIILRIR